MAQILLSKSLFSASRQVAMHQQKALGFTNFRLFSSSSFATSLHDEMLTMKVAPAASGYLRGFGVLPSQIAATGPRGHLTKQDVLAYIAKNNLTRIPIVSEVTAEAPKKAAAPKKKAPAQTAGNPNDPFTQTWEDETVSGDMKGLLDEIADAKKYLAHSYMSAKCDVSALLQNYPEQKIDAFIMKAAQKSYSKCIDQESKISVQRVINRQTSTNFDNVYEHGVGSLSAGLADSNGLPAANQVMIKVYQLEEAVEALPIAEGNTSIAIHFTSPTLEVVSSSGALTFDTNDEDSEAALANIDIANIQTAHIMKLSISYDVQKVDDQSAAEYLRQCTAYLNDTDLMLL